MNKVKATEKFYDLVSKALTMPKKRTSTRPTLSSKIKRLDGKRLRGTIKKMRKDSGSVE
jgi:ribosome-associated protein